MAGVSNTVQRVPNPSFFDAVDSAASSVAALRGRVCGLVDRLAGTYPEPAETGHAANAIKGVPNGILGEAHDQARLIADYVSVMNAALDRLEKSLP